MTDHLHTHHIGRSTIQSPEADRARAFAHHLPFAQPRTAMTDTVKSADALLPCPHCGATTIFVLWVDWSFRTVCLPASNVFVEAEIDDSRKGAGCGAYGAGFETEAEAVAAWNTRAPRRASPASLAAAKAGNVFATTGAEAQWIADCEAGVYDEDFPTPQGEAQPVAFDGVRCNRCGWEGGEDDLIGTICAVDGEPCKGCPDCKTDHGLIDIEVERDLAHPSPAPEAGDLISIAERAFKAGLEYAQICEVTDPDEAWRTSSIRQDALSAIETPVSAWQGIDSAPKDGRTMLLHGLLHYPSIDAGCPITVVGYWADHNGGGWVWHGSPAITFTHWMPLPADPAALAAQEGEARG